MGALIWEYAASLGKEPRESSPSFHVGIVEGLLVHVQRDALPTFLPEEMDAEPVLYFNDHSHIHFDGGDLDFCDCNLEPFRIIYRWNIPPPDFSLCADGMAHPAFCDQFGLAAFEAAAIALLGPVKWVSMLTTATADAGKTAWVRAIKKALPGAVTIKTHAAFKASRNVQFTPAHDALANCLLMFVDEAGRIDGKVLDKVFEISDEDVSVERKHVDLADFKRIGNTFFVGHEPPPGVDTTQQGVPERMGYMDRMDTLQPITPETRAHWHSPGEIARTRAWMIRFAVEGWGKRNKVVVTAGRDAMISDMQGEDVKCLHDYFEAVEGAFTLSADIERVLKQNGHKVPSGRAWSSLIKRSFPNAVKAQEPSGDRRKGWRNIRNPAAEQKKLEDAPRARDA